MKLTPSSAPRAAPLRPTEGDQLRHVRRGGARRRAGQEPAHACEQQRGADDGLVDSAASRPDITVAKKEALADREHISRITCQS